MGKVFLAAVSMCPWRGSPASGHGRRTVCYLVGAVTTHRRGAVLGDQGAAPGEWWRA
jgi:hypothetical protein